MVSGCLHFHVALGPGGNCLCEWQLIVVWLPAVHEGVMLAAEWPHLALCIVSMQARGRVA